MEIKELEGIEEKALKQFKSVTPLPNPWATV